MEVNITGLKCDYCAYRDDAVQFSEYEASIGKPCPECGNSLLTEKEYRSCLRIYKAVEIGNKIGKVLRWINPLYYYRLVFGDNRTVGTLSYKYHNRYPNRK